jgi:hypothetical protein
MLSVVVFLFAALFRACDGQTTGYMQQTPTLPYGIKTINVGGFGSGSAISDLASV